MNRTNTWQTLILTGVLILSTGLVGCKSESEPPNGIKEVSTGDDQGVVPAEDEGTSTDTAPDPVDGGGAAESGGDEAQALASRVMMDGISMRPGAGWTKETPSSAMRAAQYLLPGAPAGADDATFVITYFGQGGAGAMQVNIDRWVGQMKQPSGVDPHAVANVGKRAIDNMAVVTLDMTGNYEASIPRPIQVDGARMMVWAVQSAIGPYFIKVVGPEATVDYWEASLTKSVDSILSGR